MTPAFVQPGSRRSSRQDRLHRREVAAGLRRAGLGLSVERPREHPPDVGVDDRRPHAVREGGDRASGVRPDAGQREKLIDVGGHAVVVPLGDLDRRGMQIESAARVAESIPGPHRLPGGTAARSAGVGHRANHSASRGITRATGVCCSMNSLIRMPQAGYPVARHGSSRWPAAYQSATDSPRLRGATIRSA